MEVSFKREMKHNYIIIKAEKICLDNYEIQMLHSNPMKGILRFRTKITDEGLFFYYEITSRQPLSRLLESRYIKEWEIRQMLLQIAQSLEDMERHLLPEERILLEPEYIYIEPDHFNLGLCLVPGKNGGFPEDMSRLLQYMLKKVDHQDQRSVVLAYGLYQESLKENYGISDLLDQLSPVKSQTVAMEEKAEAEHIGERHQNLESTSTFHFEDNLHVKQLDSQEPYRGKTRTKCLHDDIENDSEKGLKETWKKLLIGIVSVMIALPILIWFLHGRGGLYEYRLVIAVFEGAGVLTLFGFCICWMLGKGHHSLDECGESYYQASKDPGLKTTDQGLDEERSSGGRIRKRTEKPPDWKMVFADEEASGMNYELPMQGPEAVKKAEEPFTTLLTETIGKNEACRLSSLDKQREDVILSYFPFIIGKQPGATDYVISCDTVSRLHVKFDKKDGEYLVTDLNSTNGTAVKGQLLENNQTAVIQPGDEIYIADIGYIFM